MHQANLRNFLDPAAGAKSADIDCRQQLVQHLAEAAEVGQFVAESRATAGVRKPQLTYAFIGVLVAGFAAMVILGRGLRPDRETLIAWGALHGPLVRAGQWWRIATCALVHGGVIHIFFNCYAMFYFGSLLEVLQGRWRLGVFLFFAVITGSLGSLLWHPHVVSVGASGGLFGLIGAIAALIIRHRREFPPSLWRAMRRGVIRVLAYNLIFFLVPFIDNAAHVGGFVGGLALGLILTRSPLKAARPGRWAWLAAAALGAAVAAAACWTILRIPA
jgi:rhomboid protease GluP